MTKNEVMQMAIDALENAYDAINTWGGYASTYFQEKHDLEADVSECRKSIEVLRAALAQPEQDLSRKRRLEKVQDAICANLMAVNSNSVESQPIKTQPDPEPVAFEEWLSKQHGDPEEIGFLQALRIAYISGQDSITAPPQRKPLSEEKIIASTFLIDLDEDGWVYKFARAIEAAHGIKD